MAFEKERKYEHNVFVKHLQHRLEIRVFKNPFEYFHSYYCL